MKRKPRATKVRRKAERRIGFGFSIGGSKSSSRSWQGPWSEQQPYLQDVWGKAQNIYGKPVPVAAFDPMQTQAFDMVQQQAGGPNLGAAGQGYIGNILGGNQAFWQPGMTPAQQAAEGIPASMQGLAGAGGPTLGGGYNFLGGAAQGGQNLLDADAVAMLRDTAIGGYLPGQASDNPYLDQTFQRGADQLRDQFAETVLPNIDATFANAGRTYGGAHGLAYGDAASGLTDSLGDLANRIYGDNYRFERGNQLAAANQLGGQMLGAGRLGLDTGLGAGSLYDAGQGRELAAQQSLLGGGLRGADIISNLLGRQAGQQLGALGAIPGTIDASYQDAAQLLGAGDRMQMQRQRELDAPYESLRQYADIILRRLVTESGSKSKSKSFNIGATGLG